VFFADRARYEKRSSTAKGLPLGVFSSAEGPQDEDSAQKQQCGMSKLGNFGLDQAKKEKGLDGPY
jgi:hypothetical protein